MSVWSWVLGLINRKHLRDFAAFGLFVMAYYFAYHFGMSFSQACSSPFWFPDSILLCALLLSQPRRWWIFIVSTLPIRLFSAVAGGIPLWFLLATFAIDSAKGVVTAVMLRQFIKIPCHPVSVRDLGVFSLFAVLLAPMASAFAGAAARSQLGHEFWASWQQWFMGDATVHLVVTPAILYGAYAASHQSTFLIGKRWVEVGIVMVGLTWAGYVAFHTQSVRIGLAEMRFYAPVLFLCWAAIRFGMFGASGAVAILAFLAVQAAITGEGLFAGQSPAETALALQDFLILRAAPLYLVAVLVEQKKRADVEMDTQRTELTHVARVSTLGQMASALAHELSQPLSAIRHNAEAAERILQQHPLRSEEFRDILAEIREADQRASAVIDRLRFLLKRRTLEFEALSVNQLFDQVAVVARPEMRTRRVALRIYVPDNLPPVWGDRVQLQQVLLNLLLNGADAMNESPRGSRLIRLQARLSDAQTVELSVTDTGTGIPGEKLPRLFEPFFTTKPDGMGMGLTISKTIVESHGGRIWAENNAERGAAFRFTLKAVDPEDHS